MRPGRPHLRKVLFVAYAFPPLGAVGSLIASQTVKYLGRHGWQAIVLTVRPEYHRGRPLDPSLLEDLPATVRIERTATVARRRREGRGAAAAPAQPPRGPRVVRRLLAALLSPVRWLASVLVNPDEYVLWVPFAVVAGLRIIRSEGVEAIYARSQPASSLIVGRILKRLTGTPLVVELGDYWTLAGHRRWRSAAQRRIQQRQERGVLESADAITASFDTAMYQEAYPQLRDRFRLMMLGFDREEFAAGAAPRSDRFDLTYVGKISGEQYPVEPLFQALRSAQVPGLRLTILGSADAACRDAVERLGVKDIVSFEGFVNHKTAVHRMCGANGLLLIINDSKDNFDTNYSTKLFEYLAAGRPILALVPGRGRAATLITRTGAGVVCSPRDPVAIAAGLKAVYGMGAAWRAPSREAFAEFDKDIIVGRLASILDEIVAAREGAARPPFHAAAPPGGPRSDS